MTYFATSTRRKDSMSAIEAIVPSIVPEFIASNWSKTDIWTGVAPKCSANRAQGAPPERRRMPFMSSALWIGFVVRNS